MSHLGEFSLEARVLSACRANEQRSAEGHKSSQADVMVAESGKPGPKDSPGYFHLFEAQVQGLVPVGGVATIQCNERVCCDFILLPMPQSNHMPAANFQHQKIVSLTAITSKHLASKLKVAGHLIQDSQDTY